ncbi:5783_t:CDS:2, partial [Dentiscutata heterogama]
DVYNLDAESGSSFSDQLLLSGVTITNSLGIYEKLLGALMDNTTSMIKAMNQLGIEHIDCTAYTIQLALGDGFDDTEVSNLISKAKTLNSYISSKDKYYKSLYELQAELNSQHQVNPLSKEWSSINELAKLLYPFVQATRYIGESQYPTLGMMIPTLIKLSYQ